jgi:hypothetical protein
LDKENYQQTHGISDSSKRKLQSEAPEEQSKRKKNAPDGFLDVGSVSWSILLAIFILSLHKGAPAGSLEEKYCITYEGVIEMLQVLVSEFGDMIPLESNQQVLDNSAAGCLSQLRENSLIETQAAAHQADPLKW